MAGCRAPMLSGVWYFMAGRCAPPSSCVCGFMAGCRVPMLQVDVSPWLVPVSFRLVLLSFLVAGGCVPVAIAGILQAGVVVLPGGR